MSLFKSTLFGCVVAAAAGLGPSLKAQRGSNTPPPAGPPVQVTVNGRTWTQQQLFQRNIGGPDDQTTPFAPHKIVGNIYYVGTTSLASFLVVTPQGHILINSTYERNVPIIQKSVEQLGFKFADVKILLGSHAHGDHQEGDALVKQLTGAQAMAMAEDVPALENMRPAGKPHPIDRVLHDGESVTLGGMTLVAHLTPGHTRGCTTWTMKVQDGGRTYDVVIIGSLGVNPGFKLVNNTDVPQIADEFLRAFKVSRSLQCDVPLGSHPGMFNMAEKYAKLGKGGPNPYIDPAGYKAELDLDETMFHAVLAAQQKAAAPSQASDAPTAEIKVLSSTALKGVLEELVPQFERATKHTVVIQYGTAASLKRQIEQGQPFDLAVLTLAAMDDLIAQGRIAAGTRTPIARSGMAMAIRTGARRRDVGTTDALKRALLDAKSIAYAGEGAAGVYFTALVQRLGIAEALKPKSKVTASGLLVGEAVVNGEAEIGILPLSEILPIRGAEVLGTFPMEVQGFAVMVGGVSAGAKAGAAAHDLLEFVTAPDALPVIKKKGMERG